VEESFGMLELLLQDVHLLFQSLGVSYSDRSKNNRIYQLSTNTWDIFSKATVKIKLRDKFCFHLF